MPIYKVLNKATGDERLIESPNAARAMRFVANETLTVESASASTVARMMTAGAKVEFDASKPPSEPPPDLLTEPKTNPGTEPGKEPEKKPETPLTGSTAKTEAGKPSAKGK